MFGIDDIVAKVLGIGGTLVDRLTPDVNKRQDQSHETAMKQAEITEEGEKSRNYFTPRSMIMYILGFGLCYSVVI